ncbi:Uncharacterised protein [Bordetella pertussis]|nr:Uncharacterised protein [Bordetella pertussis]
MAVVIRLTSRLGRFEMPLAAKASSTSILTWLW